MLESKEILPCPFCGSAADVEYAADWHGIYCSNTKCFLNDYYPPSADEWNLRSTKE